MTGIGYGVVRPEDIAGMSGREMLEAMLDGRFPAPPIAETLGFLLVGIGDGTAVFEGKPGPHLLNPLGGVHGGWAMTLIDSATGCALHTTLPAGIGYTTVETKVNMTRGIRPDDGAVRCEGRVLSQGRQIATADARLLSEDGKLLAHGTSTLIILRPR
ncbi:MAG TPA: PaaI family thioesterase [Reyranella sp.]|nr:PaaI family thioesterase [Reyranella sp.]